MVAVLVFHTGSVKMPTSLFDYPSMNSYNSRHSIMIFVLFSFQIDRLRILLSAHESIEDTVLWEQKIFIGATPLVNQPDELDVENFLSRKGSARESYNTGVQLSQNIILQSCLSFT